MLTSVTSVSKSITSSVPKMAVMPTIRGIADAAIAPNTNKRRRNVSGIDTASEIFRSFWIRPLMAFAKTAPPDA